MVYIDIIKIYFLIVHFNSILKYAYKSNLIIRILIYILPIYYKVNVFIIHSLQFCKISDLFINGLL